MTAIVISTLAFASLAYIGVGLFQGIRTKSIADLLPLSMNKLAQVKTATEFSSSTVASTISLATVIIVFFELAGKFGLWLFWTVITTSAGIVVMRLFAKRIWLMLSKYDHRPTLNEVLGREFNSKSISYVSSVCTSLGFLGTFALELTVSSKFFAGLVPNLNPVIMLVAMSFVIFAYTATGGFRAVIVIERLQMVFIWLLLFLLPCFYIYYVVMHGGLAANLSKIPPGVLTLHGTEGLTAFLLGIFVINVPTFLSDMSTWQRIAGSQEPQTVYRGLLQSSIGSAISWGCIILLACFAFMIVEPAVNVNPLVAVLGVIGNTKTIFAGVILFFVILGLYGAMLSTASTQLIAVSHTLYEDVFAGIKRKSLRDRIVSRKELLASRAILTVSVIVSIIIIYLLSLSPHFSIADLVFAIYGAQLGLCPLVIAAIFLKRESLMKLSGWAITAISAGFVTGWTTAVYGNLISNESLAYLPPVLSLAISTSILLTGLISISIKGEAFEITNWVLMKAIFKAKRAGLLHLAKAARPMRLVCLKDKCARCCKVLGSPVVTEKEAKKIDPQYILKNKFGTFTKSEGSTCCLLKSNLCSIYPHRPRGCREYPWYNIDGILYYDRGCPGMKEDKDERPKVGEIEPFENFFPGTSKPVVRLIKKMCIVK